MSRTSKIIYSVLVLLVITSSCKEAEKTPKIEKSSNKEIETNFSKVEHLFEEISFEQLHVFSSWDYDDDSFKFKGKFIDKTNRTYLSSEFNDKYNHDRDFAACYKFKIDNNHVGLIIRRPGEYSPTAIQLSVFDLEKDSIIHSSRVSDVFGDAGETMNYNSIIFKDENHDFQQLRYSYHSYHEIDADTLSEESHHYGLYDISYNWMDTISIDSTYIVNKYPDMIKELYGL